MTDSSHPDRTGPWRDRLGRAAVRSIQVLAVVVLAVVVVWTGVQLKLVVVPLLIATLAAAAASPVVAWLHRTGLPRALAVWTTLLTGFVVVGGVVWLVVTAVQEQWGALSSRADDAIRQLEQFVASSPLGLDAAELDKLGSQLGRMLAGPNRQSGVLTGATLVVEILTGLFLGLVLLYFLLKDGERIWTFLRGELLPERHSDRFDAIAERAVGVLGGYVRGTALIATVEALIIGAALGLLGVPLALPLALVVFVGAFVPLLGATTAGAAAALVALVSNGPGTAVIVVAVVIAVNQLEGDILSPYVLGKSVSLHPLAVLLALSAGTIAGGIIGAILAVPFAAVAWAAITAWRETEEAVDEPDGTAPFEATPQPEPA